MICQNCAHAGNLNSHGDVERAQRLHERCRWPASCTCQHATGDYWRRGEYAAS